MTIMYIITPIAKQYTRKSTKIGAPDSKRDYEEQQCRTNYNQKWMWDDHKTNKAVKGQRFGFVHNRSHIIWHIIEEVHNPSARLESWAKNVGHGDRNVLILSDPIETESWDSWINRMGYDKQYIIQGTRYCNEKKY